MSSSHDSIAQPPAVPDPEPIASRFVQARLRGEALAEFPGAIPADLVAAYRVQDHAIARWPDRIAGWKVGYIAAERRDDSGDERLLGPIFSRGVLAAGGESVGFPVFVGGFAAVEAEYVIRLQADAPPHQTQWTPHDAAALPSTLHMGVEIASSPLAAINRLGPRVVVSDFGNNNGLILGAEIPRWREIPEVQLLCWTSIDDTQVGRGGAATLPGGLLGALAFALTRSARRGRSLRAGDLIATGNATGIHDIGIGQRARIGFDGYGEIVCHAVAAVAQTASTEGTHR